MDCNRPLARSTRPLRSESAQLAAKTIRPFEDLFTGGPDTACRTVWDDGIECVSVPIGDLREAFDRAAALVATPRQEKADQ